MARTGRAGGALQVRSSLLQSAGVAWSFLFLSALVSTSRAQPLVRVQAESRIELRTTVDGAGVAVDGTLRDDLGNPLSGRAVVFEATAGDDPVYRSALTTDDDGRFHAALPRDERGFSLRARFDGDGYHQQVEVERTLDLNRADVRLRVLVPSRGRLDLDEEAHRIEVQAESAEGGDGLRLELLNELGPLAEQTTDIDGRAAFLVPSSDLGPAGAGRIKVHSGADDHRAEALTEVPVIRFRATQLTLAANTFQVAPSEPVTFEGTLSTTVGPVSGRAIGLFDGEEHLTTVLTDREGRFQSQTPISGDDRVATIQARFDSDSPGRTGSRSAMVQVTLGPSAGRSWPWLLLPVIFCALIVGWLTGRNRPEAAPAERRDVHPPVELASRRRSAATERSIAGRVLDAGDDAPIREATLRAVGDREHVVPVDAEGSFALENAEPGEWILEFNAPSYETLERRITVPHRGEWSLATIRLKSLRVTALAEFRGVVVPALASEEVWPRITNAELTAPADEALRRFEATIERIYYGPSPPTPADVEEAKRLAASLTSPEGDP